MFYIGSGYKDVKMYENESVYTKKQITASDFKSLSKKGEILDITITPTKAISVAALAIKDPIIRNKIQTAFLKAGIQTEEYIKKHALFVYSKKEHQYKMPDQDSVKSNLYVHFKTRNQDPHLHIHLVIDRNVTVKNRKFKLIKKYFDSDKINNVFNIFLAQALIENNISPTIEKGQTSVAIPEEIVSHFSTRSHEIEQMKEMCLQKNVDVEVANKFARNHHKYTKEKKNNTENDINECIKTWEARYEEELKKTTFDAKQLLYTNDEVYKAKTKITLERIIEIALESLGEKKEVFYFSEIMQMAYKVLLNFGLINAFKLESIEKEIRRQVKSLGIFDTEVLKEENVQYVREVCTLPKTQKDSLLSEELIKKYSYEKAPLLSLIETKNKIKSFENEINLTLNKEQKIFLEGVATGNKLICVIGNPGTGKTTVLRGLKYILTGTDYNLIGLAPTRAAADVMEENDIKSSTIALFLERIKREKMTGEITEKYKNTVLVVDESSMIDAGTFHDLFEITPYFKKILFIGDYKQLQPIQAGLPFSRLLMYLNHKNIFKFTKIIRQKDLSLRKVIETLCEPLSLSEYVKKIQLIEKLKITKTKDPIDTQKEILKIISENPNTVFITKTRKNKLFINKIVRAKLKECKKIEEDDVSLYTYVPTTKSLLQKMDLSLYKKWDKIVFNNNVFLYILRNRETYIEDINDERGEVVLRLNLKKGEVNRLVLKKEDFLNVVQYGTVYDLQKIKVSVGDKLLSLKNDNQKNITNGEHFYVSSIIKTQDNKKIVCVSNGKTNIYLLAGSIFNKYNYFDYGYCSTITKSQGSTYNNATFVVFKDDKLTHNDILVALSRPRNKLEIITEDKNVIINGIARLQKKNDYALYKESTQKIRDLIDQLSVIFRRDRKIIKTNIQKILDESLSDEQKRNKILLYIESELGKRKSLSRADKEKIISSITDKITVFLYARSLFKQPHQSSLEAAFAKKMQGLIDINFESTFSLKKKDS